MQISVGSVIRIKNPSTELLEWCKENLIIANPDYAKKVRMHFWVGNTPKTISLYEQDGDSIILPFGCLRSILPMLHGELYTEFTEPKTIKYDGEVSLYDYQAEAVQAMIDAKYGILQSPAGSGKTQIGIALIGKLGLKTLWLTHTKDLLAQSMARAAMYYDEFLMGTITEGKIDIGRGITFATIQTLSRIDLSRYKNMWDLIIVDECHRVAGSPTAVTMFSKVLNSLSSRHKYGLSATVHRSDGLIKSTYALLGEVIHDIPAEKVKDRIMTVTIRPVGTGIGLSAQYLNSDGTINYAKMISYLISNSERNELIASHLIENDDHYNLILSERVSHLHALYNSLPLKLQAKAVVIDGKTKKAAREQAIEDVRSGSKRYLFATYQLAKEGLDIPRLDRLYLTTPQKDYAVIVQSVGRIARAYKGKSTPIVYDYVDCTRGLQRSFERRCTHYRKIGCDIE